MAYKFVLNQFDYYYYYSCYNIHKYEKATRETRASHAYVVIAFKCVLCVCSLWPMASQISVNCVCVCASLAPGVCVFVCGYN